MTFFLAVLVAASADPVPNGWTVQPPLDATAPSGDNSEAPFAVSVKIPRRTTVGPRKAGLLCFPNGRFMIEEFVASPSYLKATIFTAFDEMAIKNPQEKVRAISLSALDVSLCARGYISNKSLFSGDATFTFNIQWPDGSESTEVLAIEVAKDSAQSEAEIIQEAAFKLAEIVAKQPG